MFAFQAIYIYIVKRVFIVIVKKGMYKTNPAIKSVSKKRNSKEIMKIFQQKFAPFYNSRRKKIDKSRRKKIATNF